MIQCVPYPTNLMPLTSWKQIETCNVMKLSMTKKLRFIRFCWRRYFLVFLSGIANCHPNFCSPAFPVLVLILQMEDFFHIFLFGGFLHFVHFISIELCCRTRLLSILFISTLLNFPCPSAAPFRSLQKFQKTIHFFQQIQGIYNTHYKIMDG